MAVSQQSIPLNISHMQRKNSINSVSKTKSELGMPNPRALQWWQAFIIVQLDCPKCKEMGVGMAVILK